MANIVCGEGVLMVMDGTRSYDLPPDSLSVVTSPFELNTHRIYVEQTYQFRSIRVELEEGASADTGALVAEYWTNNSWKGLPNLWDGTRKGANTMSSSGTINFSVPEDWERNRLFRIRLRMSNTPRKAPKIRIVEPRGGQFLRAPFVRAKIEGPIGRPRPVEEITQNRMGEIRMVQGPSGEGPLRLSVACVFENNTDTTRVRQAIEAADAIDNKTWPLRGKSTKTLSRLPDGTGELVNTEPFTDPFSRTVDVGVEWTGKMGPGMCIWREVYFNPEVQNFAENALVLLGECYGAIDHGVVYG
jgi:hypothetical protein